MTQEATEAGAPGFTIAPASTPAEVLDLTTQPAAAGAASEPQLQRHLKFGDALFAPEKLTSEFYCIADQASAWPDGRPQARRVAITFGEGALHVSFPRLSPRDARAMAAMLIECAEFAEGGAQ